MGLSVNIICKRRIYPVCSGGDAFARAKTHIDRTNLLIIIMVNISDIREVYTFPDSGLYMKKVGGRLIVV